MRIVFAHNEVPITIIIDMDRSVVYDIARDYASDNGIDLDDYRNSSIEL